MVSERIQNRLEIIEGEGLKHAAELTLHMLSESRLGTRLLELYGGGFGGRVEDERLHTEFAGIELESPYMVAAGWDKKGWVPNGLYALGFAGVEIGTVPVFSQKGNKKPRLFGLGRHRSVGLNRMGFNSDGSEEVDGNLTQQAPIRGVIGGNVGLNKLMPHEHAPWAHARVVPFLYPHVDYFVFNPASPNTPGLRELQRKEMLGACIRAMQGAMEDCGGQKPLLVKLAPDITQDIFEDAIQTTATERAAGLILANTTLRDDIKAMYGVEGQMGGISGNNTVYRAVVTRMIFEAYEEAGDRLDIIASGGVSKVEHGLEYMLAGASAVQVFTAIRPSWGRVAGKLNRGTVKWLEEHKTESVKDLVGVATQRGPKFRAA